MISVIASFIPILLVFVIAAACHMVSGYKRGIVGALVSALVLGLTCVLSVFLAKKFSVLANFSPWLSFLNHPLSNELQSLGKYLGTVAGAILASFTACGLYLILYPVILIVADCVAGIFTKKANVGKSKAGRIGGLAIGFVLATVFTLSWLAPVYGLISSGAEVVAYLSEKDGGKIFEISDGIVRRSGRFPMSFAEIKPFSTIADAVFTADCNGKKIHILSDAKELVKINSISDLNEFIEKNPNYADIIDDKFPAAAEIIAVVDDITNGSDAKDSVRKLLDADRTGLKDSIMEIVPEVGFENAGALELEIIAEVIEKTPIEEERKDEEAELLAYLLSEMSKFSQGETKSIDEVVSDRDRFAYSLLKSDIAYATVNSIVTDNIGELSDEFLSEAADLLENYADSSDSDELKARAKTLTEKFR